MKIRYSLIVCVTAIAVVIWSVGWNDRILEKDGTKHVGMIVDATDTSLIIHTVYGEEKRIVSYGTRVYTGFRTGIRRVQERAGVVVGALVFHLLGIIAMMFRWKILLDGAGTRISTGYCLRTAWIGLFVSQVLPGGVATGDAAKGATLLRTDRSRVGPVAMSIVVDRLIGILTIGLLANIALMLHPRLPVLRIAASIVLFAGLVLVLIVLGFPVRNAFRWSWLRRSRRVRWLLRECLRAVSLYRRFPRVLVLAATVAVFGHVLILIACVLYARSIGDWLPFEVSSVAIPVALIASSLPGLPGGWGIGDAAFLAVLVPFGIAPVQAVGTSMLFRLGQTILSIPGGFWITFGRRD